MTWKGIAGLFGVVAFYAVVDVLASGNLVALWH